ncbi:MAG TPA: FtsX-like permease family protein [Gemmatimonadaceae bacterium]
MSSAPVALCLAAMGLYGMISYMASKRTRELGLRIALGATPSRLLLFVMSSGVRLTLMGIADQQRRRGDRRRVVIACLLPAWLASRLDPVRALRV